jgi:hypothetical protein
VSHRDTVQPLVVAGIVMGFLALGWSFRRLNRGRPSAVERSRPRLANSSVYLRDAHDSGLSAHSRLRCVFESIYLCCCELAESHGIGLDDRTHPSVDVVDAGLTALNASSLEREVVEQLTEWANDASPFLPSVSMDDACRLAEQINVATISFFARRGPASPVEV